MSMTAPAPTSNYVEREIIPSGLAVARCYLIADLGKQVVNWQGEDKLQNKVQISFELPKYRSEFERDGVTEEGPRVIGFRLTFSMHEKANMRKHIESWFGKKFPSDEAASYFDVEKLIGKVCMINVVHNTKGDKTYANIGSLSPLMDGMEAPPAELEPVVYNGSDPAILEKLPKFMREMIAKQVTDNPLPQETAHQQPAIPSEQEQLDNAFNDDAVPNFDNDIPWE